MKKTIKNILKMPIFVYKIDFYQFFNKKENEFSFPNFEFYFQSHLQKV